VTRNFLRDNGVVVILPLDFFRVQPWTCCITVAKLDEGTQADTFVRVVDCVTAFWSFVKVLTLGSGSIVRGCVFYVPA
jgi:hypothetical protein